MYYVFTELLGIISLWITNILESSELPSAPQSAPATLSASSPCLELELVEDCSGDGREEAGSEYHGGERELFLWAVSDLSAGLPASVWSLKDR